MSENILPEKLECVGHGQKRLGTRIQNLVKQHKEFQHLCLVSSKRKLTKNAILLWQSHTVVFLWHCTDFYDKKFLYRLRLVGE